jgi:hypothetical protein
MAELMNWPPSRGPNPNAPSVIYKQTKITREDVPRKAMKRLVDKFESRRPAAIGLWYVNFQVEDVADLSLHQAVRILQGSKRDSEESDHCSDDWYFEKFEALETIIDYPLGTAVRLKIEPMTVTYMRGRQISKEMVEMRLGYFLWVVAQEYLRIYEEAEKYEIWGHAMGDLAFEGVEVYENGFSTILMGS